jgi:hypothetical protein
MAHATWIRKSCTDFRRRYHAAVMVWSRRSATIPLGQTRNSQSDHTRMLHRSNWLPNHSLTCVRTRFGDLDSALFCCFHHSAPYLSKWGWSKTAAAWPARIARDAGPMGIQANVPREGLRGGIAPASPSCRIGPFTALGMVRLLIAPCALEFGMLVNRTTLVRILGPYATYAAAPYLYDLATTRVPIPSHWHHSPMVKHQ